MVRVTYQCLRPGALLTAVRYTLLPFFHIPHMCYISLANARALAHGNSALHDCSQHFKPALPVQTLSARMQDAQR